jgi:hypothetical protein
VVADLEAADSEAVASGAADLAVVDLELGCPAGLEAGSPAAGSGAWAGRVDVGPEEAGDGGGAGDGAFLLRLASVAGDGAGAGAIHMVAGAGAIRMAMVTVVGGGAAGTSGTVATSPMVGNTEHESRRVRSLAMGSPEALPMQAQRDLPAHARCERCILLVFTQNRRIL